MRPVKILWNTPYKCEGPKTWCWPHKHLTRHKQHTSFPEKDHKDTKSPPASHGIQPNPRSGWLFSLGQGGAVLLLILLANSWADPRSSTIFQGHCRMKHPFGKCQSLWFTSCCNKHGKDSVSPSDYSSYVLQKEYVRTVSPLQTSQSERQEFSHPVNKSRAKPPRHDPSSASMHHLPGETEVGLEIPFPWNETAWRVSTN